MKATAPITPTKRAAMEAAWMVAPPVAGAEVAAVVEGVVPEDPTDVAVVASVVPDEAGCVSEGRTTLLADGAGAPGALAAGGAEGDTAGGAGAGFVTVGTDAGGVTLI